MKHWPSAVAAALVWSCSGTPDPSAPLPGGTNPGDPNAATDPSSGDGGDAVARLDGGHGIVGDGSAEGDPDTGDPGPPPGGSLVERLRTSDIVLPAGVAPGENNWRIWGQSSLRIAPVFTVPMANCGSLVCVTTRASSGGSPKAYAAVLDASDKLVRTIDLGAFECRGVAAEPDGHFAALLWAAGTASDCADATKNGRVYLKRFDLAGAAGWSKELTNPGTEPNCPTDWSIGESRVEYGGGKYGAYYHVHSKSGHEGDTLKYLDVTGTETTRWAWGCSHSMSNVLRFHPTEMKFLPACVTDCYPGTSGSDFATTSIGGLYTNNKNKVLDIDGGCNGSVAGELGGAAAAPSGWKTVFNAHQKAAGKGQSSYDKKTMNQDIGFAPIATDLTAGAVVWLTGTPSINETDASIERWQPAGDATEQYVVGWAESGTTYAYKLARVDAKGAFLEGPIDVTAKAKWGRRDDPFRTHLNADVAWSWFDAPGDTKMHVTRIRSGAAATCAAF